MFRTIRSRLWGWASGKELGICQEPPCFLTPITSPGPTNSHTRALYPQMLTQAHKQMEEGRERGKEEDIQKKRGFYFFNF